MKTIGVATLNAQNSSVVFSVSYRIILFLFLMLVLISCSSNDIDSDYIQPVTVKPKPVVPTQEPTTSPPPITRQNSVIVYTDIEPDYYNYVMGEGYDLNLNNDNRIDFTLRSNRDSFEEYLEIRSSDHGDNKIIVVTPWYPNPLPLKADYKISNLDGDRNIEHFYELGFFTIGNCYGGESTCNQDWKGKGDKYLGLTIEKFGKRYYGWARMEVFSTTEWVIKDYAYNATPNMPIFAGQKE